MNSLKKTICVTLLFCMLIFTMTGCNNPQIKQKNSSGAFETLIIYIHGKEIKIEDKIDLSNIHAIISNMKKENVANNRVISGIKGKVIFENANQKDFVLADNLVVIGDTAYSGIYECQQIYNILAQHIYDKKYIIELIEQAEWVKLVAEDMEEELMLSRGQTKELVDVLKEAEIKYNDSIAGALVRDFPCYYLQLSTRDKHGYNIEIVLVKSGIIAVNGYGFGIYETDGKLWEFVVNMLPPQLTGDEDNLLFLFNAAKVEVEMFECSLGEEDYTERKPSIVRILRNGAVEEKVVPALDGDKAIVKFIIDDKAYNIEIYENGFIYNGKYYKKPGVLKIMKSMLSAG